MDSRGPVIDSIAGELGSFRCFYVAILMVVMCTACSGDARAENTNSVSLPSAEEKTLNRGPAVNKDLFEGIRAGSFLLFPSLGFQTSYEDNIFRTRHDAKSDLVSEIQPGLIFGSNWDRHMFQFGGDAALGTYKNGSRDNYREYNIMAKGRYDITYGTDLSAGISKRRQQAGTSENDEQRLSTTGYNETTTKDIRLTRALSYLQVSLYAKDKESNLAAIGTSNYQAWDRHIYGADFGVEFLPKSKLFVNASLDRMSYSRSDLSHLKSNGGDIKTGIQYDTDGLYNWSLFFGNIFRSYNDLSVKDVRDNYLGGSFGWQPYERLRVSVTFDKGMVETSEEEWAGILKTTQRIQASYAFTPFLNAGINLGKDDLDYVGANSTSSRYDELIYWGGDCNYEVSDTVSLRIGYSKYNNNSSNLSKEYIDNRVLVGLVFRR